MPSILTGTTLTYVLLRFFLCFHELYWRSQPEVIACESPVTERTPLWKVKGTDAPLKVTLEMEARVTPQILMEASLAEGA